MIHVNFQLLLFIDKSLGRKDKKISKNLANSI